MTKGVIQEFIKFSLCFIAWLFLVVGGIMIIGYNFDKYSCETKGEIYDIDTDYNFTDCYAVLEDGKMLMRHYEEQTQRTLNVNMVK